MAKKKISWELKENVLIATLANGTVLDFDLTLFYIDAEGKEYFTKADKAGRLGMANGVKQKLGDHIARNSEVALTDKEKETELRDMWHRLTVERKWNVEGVGRKSNDDKVSTALDSGVKVTREGLDQMLACGLIKQAKYDELVELIGELENDLS